MLSISNIQNKSIQLSLLLSLPASLGLIIASEEIVNGLFGYGSFTLADVKMTSDALRYFGYGVVAFALVLEEYSVEELLLLPFHIQPSPLPCPLVLVPLQLWLRDK